MWKGGWAKPAASGGSTKDVVRDVANDEAEDKNTTTPSGKARPTARRPGDISPTLKFGQYEGKSFESAT